jgi:hypothetical protein
VLLLALIANSAASNEGSDLGGIAVIFGVGGAYVAYCATFIIGLPLFILFHVQGWRRAWQVSAGGLLVGALVALLFQEFTMLGLMFCAVGLTTGLAFWLIAIFRNRALTTGSRSDAPKTARA